MSPINTARNRSGKIHFQAEFKQATRRESPQNEWGEASTSATPPGRPTGKGLKFWSTRWLWPWSRKECRTTTSMPWLASKPSVFSHLGTEGAESGHRRGTARPQWHSRALAHGVPSKHPTWCLLPAPELKPSDGFVSWLSTSSHHPCPSKPACLSTHHSHLCRSCARPEPLRARQHHSPVPKAWVLPQPASTLHPPPQQRDRTFAPACLLTPPQGKSSTLTACHSPDTLGMSPCLPKKPG